MFLLSETVPLATDGVARAWVFMADVRFEAKCDGEEGSMEGRDGQAYILG